MKDTKKCLRCQELKSIEAFQIDKRGRRNVCIKCRSDSEKLLKRLKKQWLAEHGQQPERCECCGKDNTKLVLDHCHDTETVRGWLCNPCNVAIGNLGDTLEGVMRAARYLERKL